MDLKFFFIYILLVSVPNCSSYYWKDYFGAIPKDAIEAGTDVNNEKLYIGLAFIRQKPAGIYATSIQPGKEVYAQIYGVRKADNFVQILCGPNPEFFHWIPTNSTHLHLLKTDNQLVRGGVEGNNWLHIGRVKYRGGTSVGKVVSSNIGNAELWFVHNGNKVKSNVYEILTYSEVPSTRQYGEGVYLSKLI